MDLLPLKLVLIRCICSFICYHQQHSFLNQKHPLSASVAHLFSIVSSIPSISLPLLKSLVTTLAIHTTTNVFSTGRFSAGSGSPVNKTGQQLESQTLNYVDQPNIHHVLYRTGHSHLLQWKIVRCLHPLNRATTSP